MFVVPKNVLFSIGLPSAEKTFYQLSREQLTAQCVQRGEGVLNDTGALVISTGKLTGQSPKGRFIVKDNLTASAVNWNDFNQPIADIFFDRVYKKMIDYLQEKEIWIRDCYACIDAAYRLNVRVINEEPAGNLFAYNMFLRPTDGELKTFNPDWHIIHAPHFLADPATDGTLQENFTLINFTKRVILIGGPANTDEIEKSIFYVLNFTSAQ